MKTHQLISLVAGALVLSTATGFALRVQSEVSKNNSAIENPTVAQITAQTPTRKPQTTTATINVEGEPIKVTQKLYQQTDPRFSTYYIPDFFVPEPTSSGEGSAIRFVVNSGGTRNENAYIHFAFLNGTRTLSQVRQFVTGNRGLIASNGWRVTSRTRNVPYRWAKERIDFQKRQGNETMFGSVYLGESNGRAFYVISQFPGEYGDGFSPRANLLLKNVEVRR